MSAEDQVMSTATIEDVQARLPEILAKLAPGEAVVITRDGTPVARLLPEAPKGKPVIGRGKGTLVAYTDDEEHLKDFAEYMP
jgi:antitoxin (DNA-binding transcriptional repressor) of toxin-antitoxin stability system